MGTQVQRPRIRGRTRAIQIHATHTFEPEGTGTKYTWSMVVHHPNLVGRLFTRVTSSLIDRTIADQHRTLAAWLDGDDR
jgi:hypothetical protein